MHCFEGACTVSCPKRCWKTSLKLHHVAWESAVLQKMRFSFLQGKCLSVVTKEISKVLLLHSYVITNRNARQDNAVLKNCYFHGSQGSLFGSLASHFLFKGSFIDVPFI